LKLRLLLFLFLLTCNSCITGKEQNVVSNSLGEQASKDIQNFGWKTGADDPSDFNDFINGENGLTTSPIKGDCHNNEVAPYGPRCTPIEGEVWDTIILDGQPVRVPVHTSVIEFLDKCYHKKIIRPKPRPANLGLTTDTASKDFSEYSNSPEVTKMLKRLRTNATKCTAGPRNRRKCTGNPSRKPASKPTGYCFVGVKLGLQAGGLTKGYMNGLAASKAGSGLKAEGFKNLMDDPKYKKMTPYTAPKGAIIVYAGGPYGHIEVKGEDNEYISDYQGSKPIYDQLGLNRRPIGIYIK